MVRQIEATNSGNQKYQEKRTPILVFLTAGRGVLGTLKLSFGTESC